MHSDGIGFDVNNFVFVATNLQNVILYLSVEASVIQQGDQIGNHLELLHIPPQRDAALVALMLRRFHAQARDDRHARRLAPAVPNLR